jgi:hypothetical protein
LRATDGRIPALSFRTRRAAVGALILLVSRTWDQQVEWAIHAPIALAAGIDTAIIDAIAAGRRPAGLSDDDAIVHDFTIEISATRAGASALWRARRRRPARAHRLLHAAGDGDERGADTGARVARRAARSHEAARTVEPLARGFAG